jgi:hypothetical protein
MNYGGIERMSSKGFLQIVIVYDVEADWDNAGNPVKPNAVVSRQSGPSEVGVA